MSDIKNESRPDFDGINEDDEAAMSQAKLWLFKENMRLMSLENDLDEKSRELQKEMDSLRDELKLEMKKLKVRESQLILQKKHVDDQLNILRRGFEELNADKEAFEAEKKRNPVVSKAIGASLFFKGINTKGKLKRRYRELLKIFHPDNGEGDEETVIMIQKEYELIKDDFFI